VQTGEDSEELEQMGGKKITIVDIDTSKQSIISAAVEKISATLKTRKGMKLIAVINLPTTAGVGVVGPLQHIELEKIRLQMEMDAIGPIAIAKSFLPLLLLAKGGVVVNVAPCVAAFSSGLFASSVGAVKAALLSLTMSLRLELHSLGVKVVTVEPISGLYSANLDKNLADRATYFFQRIPEAGLRRYKKAFHGWLKLNSDPNAAKGKSVGPSTRDAKDLDTVDAIFSAISSRHPLTNYTLSGRRTKLFSWLMNLLPDTTVQNTHRQHTIDAALSFTSGKGCVRILIDLFNSILSCWAIVTILVVLLV
jgi:NAD(P)-dependent dehydrogenase (short-subunit alcohol dehydrogenase family)